MDAGHIILMGPDLIHLADVEVAKRSIERVVSLIHLFDALLQHAESLTRIVGRIILQSQRRGEGRMEQAEVVGKIERRSHFSLSIDLRHNPSETWRTFSATC